VVVLLLMLPTSLKHCYRHQSAAAAAAAAKRYC